MLPIHLQVKAKADLKNILQHSVEQWGLTRAEQYYDDLSDGINSLKENPKLGFARDDIKAGYRQLAIEKHHVFYRLSSTQIRIIRILHDKMLKAKQL
jgi:toxin ParE1/3/4